MDVRAREGADGTRMSWNVWPSTRSDAAQIAVPLGCLYTPLKAIDSLALVEYEPVVCRSRDCGAALNPYCLVEFRSKTWGCPFCQQRNLLPPHYAEHITETNLPVELRQTSTTIEYIIPQSACQPPVFLFVLDVALDEEELEQAKDSLRQCLAIMPQNALVGFITFGAIVYVHELCASALPKACAFRGGKEATAEQVASQLGLREGAALEAAGRFLMPAAECEFALSSLLDDLSRDAGSQAAGRRPLRCTGAALSVALGLVEMACPQSSVRVSLIVGGPCNMGPGAVCGEELAETIRSHLDLQKWAPNARYTKEALKFYAGLAGRAAAAGFAVDIFACSFDQVGLHEMRALSDRSGGYMVMSDSCSLPHVFKDSFRKVFDCDEAGYLNTGFNARLEVLTSRELRCCGAVGGVASLGKRGSSVADQEIGVGGTCQWVVGSLDKNTSIGFFFDVTGTGGGRKSFLQFQTCYLHSSGRRRLRITTCSHRMVEALDPSVSDVAAGFDQEAAAVLMARYAVFKCEQEDPLDVLRWVDRTLIKLVAKFADYRQGEAASFSLSPEFSVFPQFMYHLRRGGLLQTRHASPDETAYYRTVILRENVVNSLTMMQPALLQYSLDGGPPRPVMLDAGSLKPDVVLLLDAFFQVVIWRGEWIQAWCDQGYQDREEYAHLKALLQAPAEDARQILNERLPAPRFVQTCAGGGQSCFLRARLNPSTTRASTASGFGESTASIGDDVSLKVFIEHLINFAVQS